LSDLKVDDLFSGGFQLVGARQDLIGTFGFKMSNTGCKSHKGLPEKLSAVSIQQ